MTEEREEVREEMEAWGKAVYENLRYVVRKANKTYQESGVPAYATIKRTIEVLTELITKQE